jgi:hypothetical protein
VGKKTYADRVGWRVTPPLNIPLTILFYAIIMLSIGIIEMKELLFGTGGTPHSAKTPSAIDGIKRIAELGLGCMELEFVHGVRMAENSARMVAETAQSLGVKLSAHGPYYINLNAREPEKIAARKESSRPPASAPFAAPKASPSTPPSTWATHRKRPTRR